EVNITIPTVFLSKKGGGIFFSLAKRMEQAHLPSPSLEQGDVLAEVSLSYNTLQDKKEGHSIKIDYRDSKPSKGMQLGHLLVDQFTSLHRAVTEHYMNNDQEKAYQLLKTVLQKLIAVDRDDLEQEVELVSALEQRFAFLSGNQSEAQERKPQIALWGSWEITRTKGNVSLRRGEYMSFNPAGEFFVHKQKDDQMVRTEFEDYISNDDQFYLSDSEITFEYDV